MEDYIKKAIEQMKRGEEKGFNTIYSATYNRVYFRAKQIMKKEEDAQDLTQIVFTEAYKNIHTLQAVEALYGWLDGITYHQGMKIYRKQKDVLLTEEAEGMFEEIESNDISSMPELTADQKATAEIIKGIIEELPELQKTAVVAYYFDGLKVEQIAEMMECSVNTVKSRLNYARKYIKNRVEEKEKEGGYRLHVFGLPVLWHALKRLAEETSLSAYAAQKVYGGACANVGLEATPLSTSMTGTEAGTVTGKLTEATLDAGTSTGTGATTGMTTESASGAGVGSISSIGTTTGVTTKGTIRNSILKNVFVAGVSFGLSFAGTFGVSQMMAAPIEITSVEQAQAILDGHKMDTAEVENEVNIDAEPVQNDKQEVPQAETQEALQEAVDESAMEEIYFDWSFDDWRYNGVHISEGFDAVARSFGLDPTLETDNVESDKFGMMYSRNKDGVIEVYDEQRRVSYEVQHVFHQIDMLACIFDENGKPVDVSDITSVPFTAGTQEEAEAFFHIPEIMEKGEKIESESSTYNGIELGSYKFMSNFGEAKLGMSCGESNGVIHISYTIWFFADEGWYMIDIGGWDENQYTVRYSFHS